MFFSLIIRALGPSKSELPQKPKKKSEVHGSPQNLRIFRCHNFTRAYLPPHNTQSPESGALNCAPNRSLSPNNIAMFVQTEKPLICNNLMSMTRTSMLIPAFAPPNPLPVRCLCPPRPFVAVFLPSSCSLFSESFPFPFLPRS